MKSILLILPGLLFGAGLLISEMHNPLKVIAFLDVGGGAWDPSLAFVMVGAIGTFAVFNRLVHRRKAPLLEGKLPGPRSRSRLNRRVWIGAGLFGVGWGLGGLCPGPALTNLAGLHPNVLTFVASMLLGMLAAQRVLGADSPSASTSPASP